MSWLKATDGGVEVVVLVQPRASKTKVIGEHDGRLKIALCAAPVDGEANAALIDFLSEALDVKKSAVTLVEGDTSRRKRLRVMGVAADTARASLWP